MCVLGERHRPTCAQTALVGKSDFVSQWVCIGLKFCTSHYCLGLYVPVAAQEDGATRRDKRPCHKELLHKLKPLCLSVHECYQTH